jgi:hypothetical protein
MQIYPEIAINPTRGLFDYGKIVEKIGIRQYDGTIALASSTVPLTTISSELANYVETLSYEEIKYSGTGIEFSLQKLTYSPPNTIIYSLSGNSIFANTITYSTSFEILRGISQLFLNPPRINWRGF